MDSNHRRRKPADLQSAPFGHSGICPSLFLRASCRIRTNDPEITNHVLWPTELKRHYFAAVPPHRVRNGCKFRHLFHSHKIFAGFLFITYFFLVLNQLFFQSFQTYIYRFFKRITNLVRIQFAVGNQNFHPGLLVFGCFRFNYL